MLNEQILNFIIFSFIGIIVIGIFALIINDIKNRFKPKENIELDELDISLNLEPNFRYCEYDLELKKHKNLITMSDAFALREKMINKASTKLYKLVSDKINSRINYRENDDGELEFIVNEEMMAEVLAELQNENEIFRKLTE